MNIRGIYKTSLIDFPGKISTVLFTGGCNLRCGYCHNPDLAADSEVLERTSNEEALALLKKRKNVIDGVTITGGEPTLLSDLESFLRKIKELDLAVKLDSNGLRPSVLERLVRKKLIDYAAIDIKTSPGKYREVTNRVIDFRHIAESVDIVRSGGIGYEVRTTCVPAYVTIEDLAGIRDAIGRVKNYYLQQFQHDIPLLDRSWETIEPYPAETLRGFRDFVLTFADRCEIRGI
jgi:pyruvate formate lyase activating enzyme